MRGPAQRLLVFAKAPVPGRVKTRLIPALGAVRAAALHARLVDQTLAITSRVDAWRTELWCHPDRENPDLVECAGRHHAVLREQTGIDLGERMHNAFVTTLAEAERAVLIGTDCPGLRVDHISRAFEALRVGADAVLGPAIDGGYYLIGLGDPEPEAFVDVPWGSETVLASTRQRLQGLGLRVSELPMLRDLDRPQDLRYFPALDTALRSDSIS